MSRYEQPDLRRSIWQIVNSAGPYLVLWVLMYLSLSVSYWLTLALAVPAAGFLTRIFIISHDCGHGSFFRSRRANGFWGAITSALTFIPYHHWRHEHAVHHALVLSVKIHPGGSQGPGRQGHVGRDAGVAAGPVVEAEYHYAGAVRAVRIVMSLGGVDEPEAHARAQRRHDLTAKDRDLAQCH